MNWKRYWIAAAAVLVAAKGLIGALFLGVIFGSVYDQELPGARPEGQVNAFHTVSRETFTAEVARLDSGIPKMNGDEIAVGLMRIVALIGDGHTHLDLPPNYQRYPLEFQWFGNELRVIAAAAPYHAAVGARVIAIGSTPILEVLERTSRLVPRGENNGRTRYTATMQFASPEILHGLGIIADRGSALFALEAATGESLNMTLSPAAMGNHSAWQMAMAEKPPLYLQRLNQSWWSEFLPDAKTVYFSFTAYPSDALFRERTAALAQLLDAISPDLAPNNQGTSRY